MLIALCNKVLVGVSFVATMLYLNLVQRCAKMIAEPIDRASELE